ncbi:MAG: MXAN_6640 family putative metalloprotease, partial [Solirubrobacterales bacterium]
GYLVIDDDYAPAEYGYRDPLEPARVTFAHEFNHLLQQNYDSFQDRWMFEATATWSEDLVFPAVNDYVAYVGAFASSPGAPITNPTAVRGLKIYGAAVWNHWLSGSGGGYGVDVVRRAWEVSGATRPKDFAVGAYDKSIRGSKGNGFSREFAAFAAATAEWRTGFGGFPDRALYPDMKRKGSLRKGQGKRFRLDHTAIRLLDVRARGGGAIRLCVRAEEGVRAGLALVARAGDALSGRVTRKSEYLRTGGNGSVRLDAPGRFERITAVISNADGRVKGFDGADWIYRKENQDFRVRLKGARAAR